MLRVFESTIVLLLVFGSIAAAEPSRSDQRNGDAVSTGIHSAAVERRLDRWFHEAMDLIYLGRPSSAARIAEAMREAAPQDPRPYLLKARVLRLDVSDQNFEREAVKAEIAPINEELKLAVAAAERLLDEDPVSIPGLLYRGWARMFQSQLSALSYDYWNAGRKARVGKQDLDRVLELNAENPDAHLMRGAYLYFAGILPGVVKLASIIARIPRGDTRSGIEGIQYAATRHGYGRNDARALMGVVFFGFEGRLEDAARQFEAVIAEFPNNARILEPLALIDLFLPQQVGRQVERMERGVRINADSPEPWIRKIAARLRLYQALTELLTGQLDAARANLETLLEDLPDQPDWLEGAVKLTLADVHLMRGDHRSALRVRDRTTANARLRQRLSYVIPPTAAASERDSNLLLAVQDAAKALYAGDLQDAERRLNVAAGADTPIPCVDFYRGEIALLRNQPAKAQKYFERITRREIPERYRLFRYFAFLHEAEAHGMLGNNDAAADALGAAIEFHQDRDLMRHVAKARQRYFKNGQPATEHSATHGRRTRSD